MDRPIKKGAPDLSAEGGGIADKIGEGVTASASYHYEINGSTQALTPQTRNEPELADHLLAAARATTSGARGIRAILWVIGAAKAHHVQALPGGCYYIELCPHYLTTCEGVTSWSARNAWAEVGELVQWHEVTADGAAALGATLRQKARGRRFGRHLIIDGTQLGALRSAYAVAVADDLVPAPEEVHERSDEREEAVQLRRLPGRAGSVGGRTVAARCPRHEDRHPSLVLWRNADGATGGSLCMSCRARSAVRYHASIAYLRPPRCAVGASQMKAASAARNNKDPQVVLGGPIGGHVATSSKGLHIGASLSADMNGTLMRSRGGRLTGDPIRVLQWSDGRSKGPAAVNRAAFLDGVVDMEHGPPEAWLPTSLASVSRMVPESWEPTRWGWRPSGWRSVRQDWILIDIDDVHLHGVDEDEMAERIRRVVKRDAETSGRAAVIRTGPSGVQVWVELREPRHNPTAWHRLPQVVEWYTDLGRRVLAAVRRSGGCSGHVDLACCAAGRFARRPGWRVLDNGQLWRTRLVASFAARVRGREPRK
jgi:hypothetical protein